MYTTTSAPCYVITFPFHFQKVQEKEIDEELLDALYEFEDASARKADSINQVRTVHDNVFAEKKAATDTDDLLLLQKILQNAGY